MGLKGKVIKRIREKYIKMQHDPLVEIYELQKNATQKIVEKLKKFWKHTLKATRLKKEKKIEAKIKKKIDLEVYK